MVSVRGEAAVMVISVEAPERIAPGRPRAPFVDFMESLHLDGLDLTREPTPAEMGFCDRLAARHQHRRRVDQNHKRAQPFR